MYISTIDLLQIKLRRKISMALTIRERLGGFDFYMANQIAMRYDATIEGNELDAICDEISAHLNK